MTEQPQASSGWVPEWTIGDRMRKARESVGLDQAQFAREVSIGRTSIVRYETGQSAPSRVGLRAWTLRTGVSFEWLCHGDTEPCDPPGLRRSGSRDSTTAGMSNSMQSLPTLETA